MRSQCAATANPSPARNQPKTPYRPQSGVRKSDRRWEC